MANLESMREALNKVEDLLSEADVLTHAFMDLQGDKEANMLVVYSRHVWRLKDVSIPIQSLNCLASPCRASHYEYSS